VAFEQNFVPIIDLCAGWDTISGVVLKSETSIFHKLLAMILKGRQACGTLQTVGGLPLSAKKPFGYKHYLLLK